MKCKLCENEIADHNQSLAQFRIDEKNSVNICQDCADKFLKWQGSVIAKLFPTKAMKKRFKKY
jgi:hypothetical protein